MNPPGLCYLATPYTRYAGGLDQAFKDAARIAAHLLMAGVKVYSPICHTHPIAVFGALNPRDHSIWLPFDEAMMAAAQTLIVAHLEGWHESHGIAREVKFFQTAGKPIFDLDPRTLIMGEAAMKDSFEKFQAPDRGRFGDNEAAPDRARGPRVTGSSDLKDLELKQHAKTGKAILVSDGQNAHKPQWLPLSQIEIEETGRYERVWNDDYRERAPVVIVTLPAWLAGQKGLI